MKTQDEIIALIDNGIKNLSDVETNYGELGESNYFIRGIEAKQIMVDFLKEKLQEMHNE